METRANVTVELDGPISVMNSHGQTPPRALGFRVRPEQKKQFSCRGSQHHVKPARAFQ